MGLAEHYILGRRLGQLATGKKAWLRHIGPDQRIHGGLVHIGTPHHRAKHLDPNLAQVPNPKKGKPFATECRSLFRTKNDWVFVTCDQAGLQDRAFAHYLAEFDGGAYARDFVAGMDTHWNSVLALGLVPAGTARDKESKFHTALREGAKSFAMAFCLVPRPSGPASSSATPYETLLRSTRPAIYSSVSSARPHTERAHPRAGRRRGKSPI